MKIKKIKINSFGKLKEKNISFGNNINIIYGKNEAGKSTLMKFICGMLYGLSKNKNGELVSDMEKYKPWDNGSFSGKIDYEMDDGTIYGVYRDFNKKNPTIYNELGEDISGLYKRDKTNGIAFFEEQSNVNKELYLNTAIVEQEKTRLKATSQMNIVSKITNLVTTGDDVVSYKDTISKLKNEQLEKIGSDRSIQKPINRLNSQIEYLTKEKIKLEQYKSNLGKNEMNKDALNQYIDIEKRKLYLLKRGKANQDHNHKIKSEIEVLKNNQKELNNKIQELEGSEYKGHFSKSKILKNVILVLMSIIIIAITWIMLNNIYIKSIITTIISIVMLIFIIKAIVSNRSYKEKDGKRYNKVDIQSEISILNDNYNSLCIQYDEKMVELENMVEEQYNQLSDECNTKEERDYVNNIFDMSEKELEKEIETKFNSIYEADVKLRLLNQEIENSNQKIEELLQLEEQLEYLNKEKGQLEYLNTIYDLTKQCVEEAYTEIKKNISPKYRNNLSLIIDKVSDSKYSRVDVNDDGIMVETEYGELVPIELLSTGTIDQIYLSLRLSIVNEITDEKIPIFFDETFAYFDDERLANILEYLNNYYSDRQICIFTCSRREIEVLENMNMDYNLIKL